MTAITAKRTVANARRDTTINLRVPTSLRDLFDAAAEEVGKTRTQFLLDSARAQAIDVLLDKKVFKLDDASFAAFSAVLDQPPAPNEKLQGLFAKRFPWES